MDFYINGFYNIKVFSSIIQPTWLQCVISYCATEVFFFVYLHFYGASQVALVVKNPPAKAGDTRDVGSIPGLGRSPGGRHGNPLQSSCLENPVDSAAWRLAGRTTQRDTESDTIETM